MEMLSMTDGTIEYVSDIYDFADLIDRYMGLDAKRWLLGILDEELQNTLYAAELEKECEEYRAVIGSIRKHSERLAELIREKELDRREISNAAESILLIAGKEANT